MTFRKFKVALAATVAIPFAMAANATELEVMHWWTSGGEAAALDVLKKDLESKGLPGWVESTLAERLLPVEDEEKNASDAADIIEVPAYCFECKVHYWVKGSSEEFEFFRGKE